MTLRAKSLASVVFVTAALALASCGGGGSSSSNTSVAVSPPPPPPPPPPPSSTDWTQGQFAAKETHAAKCTSIRSGSSPITGNPYPDRAGTEADEKFWVRSWNNETYLWYDEVTDINPNSVSGVVPYFNTQRTTAQTASGKDKDDFHFSQPTTDYEQGFSSGAELGYGARIVLIRSTPTATEDREVRIVYTESGGPADAAGMMRGALILEIDGADVLRGNDTATLNAGLFPSAEGETHEFKFQNVGSSTIQTVTLTAAVVDEDPVNTFSTIDTATGKVGYMLFNTFSPASTEGQMFDAFTSLKADGVTDFVLDLRYNGGGRIDFASQMAYMIAGDAQTSGKVFTRYRENDKQPPEGPIPFLSQTRGNSGPAAGIALPSLDLPRLFILTTGRSCSASELVPNALRGIDVEVIMIGDRTCGKPYGFLPTDNCGTTFYTIQFQAVNAKGFGDYADGFVPETGTSSGGTGGIILPGCVVEDNYLDQLGDPEENLLEAALAYRTDGTCPAALVSKTSNNSAQKAYGNEGLALGQTERIRNSELIRNSMIVTPDMGLNK